MARSAMPFFGGIRTAAGARDRVASDWAWDVRASESYDRRERNACPGERADGEDEGLDQTWSLL